MSHDRAPPPNRPLWIVCEDGHEYTERFERFLSAEFRFSRAGDFAALAGAVAGADGVLLDLDFRRAAPGALVDERGNLAAPSEPEERRRLAEAQGILILRLLRARGVSLPALLFADLDDPGERELLERTLAPLAVVPGNEGLPAIAARMRAARRG